FIRCFLRFEVCRRCRIRVDPGDVGPNSSRRLVDCACGVVLRGRRCCKTACHRHRDDGENGECYGAFPHFLLAPISIDFLGDWTTAAPFVPPGQFLRPSRHTTLTKCRHLARPEPPLP